jgi:zinc transport system ATP-binding protein
MALINCSNITMSYEDNIVFKDLSFEVNKGDYLCIVGENGSGKSTLVRGLLGLKSPVSGKIEYGDGLKKTEIGYLPQQTSVQKDFPASVYEVVLSGCLNSRGIKPFYSKAEKNTALKNMKRLGIEDLKQKCYRELSGGQQQRVLLARALCATKKILLLDEPVSGLDPLVAAEMYKLIKELNSVDGITIIMVSHDINSAIKNSNYMLHINDYSGIFCKTSDYEKSEMGIRFLGE